LLSYPENQNVLPVIHFILNGVVELPDIKHFPWNRSVSKGEGECDLAAFLEKPFVFFPIHRHLELQRRHNLTWWPENYLLSGTKFEFALLYFMINTLEVEMVFIILINTNYQYFHYFHILQPVTLIGSHFDFILSFILNLI